MKPPLHVAPGVIEISGVFAVSADTAVTRADRGLGPLGAIAAAFGVTPLSGLGLIFGIVSLARSRKARARGRGMAITGVVLGTVGLVSVLLGVPFWGVEVCLSVTC